MVSAKEREGMRQSYRTDSQHVSHDMTRVKLIFRAVQQDVKGYIVGLVVENNLSVYSHGTCPCQTDGDRN